MDGGNKVGLDLDAGLDVNTSDMLVPVNNNTWQHNWQKYQGKFLPNSVRFEKNGWAAGWDVYDFKYENIRVQLADDLYANCIKLNDVPVYLTCLYNAEYSADVLKSERFTVDSIVLDVDRGTASFTDAHTLACSYSDVTCNIVFDPVSKALSASTNDVVLDYRFNKEDGTYDIQLVKRDDYEQIDVAVKQGSTLNCDQFIDAFDFGYTGFDAGQHIWGNDKAAFNGSILSVNGNSVSYTVDDNLVTFDFDEVHSVNLGINMDFHDYVEEYDDISLMGNKYNSTAVVNYEADSTKTVNCITCALSSNDLTVSDSFVTCDVHIPTWLTVTFKCNINYNLGAWEPDNTQAENIQFKQVPRFNYGWGEEPTALSGNTLFKAKSIFDNEVKVGTLEQLGNILEHRYNIISIGNSIKWKDDRLCKAQVNESNTPVWYGYLGCFRNIRNTTISDIAERLRWWGGWSISTNSSSSPRLEYRDNGCDYFLTTFKYKPQDYIADNNVWNPNNSYCKAILTTKAYVENIASIRDKDAPDSIDLVYDTPPDLGPNQGMETMPNYIGDWYDEGLAWNIITNKVDNETNASTVGVQGPYAFAHDDYTSSETYHTMREIYGCIPSGPDYFRMAGGNTGCSANHKAVMRRTKPDIGYFPFYDAPQFNYKGSAETGDEGTTVAGVYAAWKPDGGAVQLITTLSDFISWLFGTWDNGYYENPVFPNTYGGRTRIVTVANGATFYDFDKFGVDTPADVRLNWSDNWKRWYPNVPDPQTTLDSFSDLVSIADDTTFLDFNDIETETDNYRAVSVKTLREESAHLQELYDYLDEHPDDIDTKAQIQRYERDDRPIIYISYSQPGINIYDAGIAANIAIGYRPTVALSCFNSLGIIPWKDGTTHTNRSSSGTVISPIQDPFGHSYYPSVYVDYSDHYNTELPTSLPNASIITQVYYNNTDKSTSYTKTASNISANIQLSFRNNYTVNIAFTSLKSFNDSVSISHSSEAFSCVGIDSCSATVTCAGFSAQITGNNNDCWLNSVSVSNGAVSASNLKWSSDVIKSVTVNYDHYMFALVSVCWNGHAGLKLRYNKASAIQQLTRYNSAIDNNSISYNNDLIEIFKLPDNELLSGKFYIDRGNNYLYDVFIDSFEPLINFIDSDGNEVSGDFGRFGIKFESRDTGTFYVIEGYDTYYPCVNDAINGNMTFEPAIDTAYLVGEIPELIRVPVNAWLTMDYADINHIFFKDGVYAINNSTLESITQYDDIIDNIVNIQFNIEDNLVLFSYNIGTGILSISNTQFTISDATVNIASTSINYEDVQELVVGVNTHYTNVTGNFAEVLTDDYNLISFTDNVYTIGHSDISFNYNIKLNKVNSSNIFVNKSLVNDTYNISFIYGDTQNIKARFNYLDNDNLSIEYKGSVYTFDTSAFFSDQNDITSIEAVDIRKDSKTKYIGEINASEEFQLIKQQWNSTIDVENFWWVDSTHILVLDNQKFTLKRNTFELDDWNGNRWENVYELPRLRLIGSEAIYYTVLNVYESDDSALFMIIKIVNGKLQCTFYDIINKLTELGHITLDVHNIAIGNTLNTNMGTSTEAYLNTYSTITNTQVLAQAKWSNTMRGGSIIIGCHMNNNFDQWAIVIDKDTFNIVNCIQGYGFVSLKGDLTGGQIPSDYFNKDYGFIGKVEDISTLTKLDEHTDLEDPDNAYTVANNHESDINTVVARVVGTADRQYYICKKIDKVVSHLVFNNGAYTVEYLPITSVFDAVYKSPSFISEVLYDNKLISKALSSLFDSTGAIPAIWRTFVSVALDPDIYLYAPKLASITYLQQTFGQYAYVHYNSTHNPETAELRDNSDDLAKALGKNGQGMLQEINDPLLSDEITFDKQILKQSGDMPFNNEKQNLLFLFNVFLPAIKAMDNKLSINEGINLNTVNDAGKVFTQAVSENLTELLAKTLHTDAPTTALTSAVVGVRSLDMFYSTSDNQRVFAGPGFVEHQFVADCVAQSVTDVQMSCFVEQLSFVIKVLSTWKVKMAYLMTKFVNDMASKIADYTATTTVGAAAFGFDVTTNAAGVAAGIAAIAVLQIAMIAMRGIMIAQEEVDGLISKLADQMKADNTDSAIRQKIDTEAKHKYGEKSEYFMWPCWGIPNAGLDYNDETVVACAKKTDWSLDLVASKVLNSNSATRIITDPVNVPIEHSTADIANNRSVQYTLKGEVPLYVASCYGKTVVRKLPQDMAKIEGVSGFLPVQSFKNQNIGVSAPVFTPSLFQDYIIDKQWQLSQCVTYGLTQWVSCKDTKLINCAPSNMVITGEFCGVACPYTAVEVKRGLSKDYMRPWAITPNVLAFNCTGFNTALDDKLYHAFDGMSYRITEWTGSPGLNKNNQTFLYSFQLNDRFKRSNKFPANEVQGNFDGDPGIDINTIDKVYTLVTNAAKQKGMEGGTIGEDKDVTRWALPIFTEQVAIMPATVKTLTAMQLNVYDGITALTTNIMNNQTAYKAPASIDFIIGKNTYRYTNDYICLVQTKEGIDVITEITPVLGLTFIGASLTEAYFYSQATRFFYVFTGSVLMKMDMLERFRNIKSGAWDFINHEVIMPCLMTYTRLDSDIKDNDTETDNIIVPVISKDKVSGELPPPITTIFNDRSWYKTISLPSGLAYQGPNRVIINRSVFIEYMLGSFKSNIGKWKRMDRENYDNKRVYSEQYTFVNKNVDGVSGWTYNPFVLVTSPLGLNEDTDCLFEWTITFCWPVEMDFIYGVDNYAVVNIMSETMTPGGKVTARPTHVYLTKELFTRNGNYGYYSFTYQSKNGSGNRERLHIWSDQYIAISSITCESKIVTSRRTEILTQQADVKDLIEL